SCSVNPASAPKLAFTSGTPSVSSGSTKTLTAAVEDANNNVVTSDSSTVVVFSQTAGAGSVTGLGNAMASAGVASLTVTGQTAGSVTVQAAKQGGGFTTDNSTFTVTPGTATKLAFTSGTASVVSGATLPLAPPIEDANNNVVTSDSSTVVVFSQTAGAGSVTGLGNATASAGVASLTVTGQTAGSVTVQAAKQGGGLTTDTSTFTVTPGTATKLAFTSGTSSVASGSTKTLTAAVEDANNNVVTSDSSTVVVFSQTAGAGSVTGLGNATASSGVASLTVTGQTAGSVTTQAAKQGGGLTTDTSIFSVTPGSATKLAFTSNTSSVASGSTKTLTAAVED